ncbi:MAG: 3'(2'),5'-bisphosphate nucleotidase CysQ [Rhizobiaceae bacterium]
MLAVCERLALEASRIVLDVFTAGAAVEHKRDHSPVTEADRASERLIVAGLREAFPAIPCVAEEEISAGHVPGDLDGQFFLVDPLDGTREFINRHADFTVNIALVRAGVPVLGIVVAPVSQTLYAGRPGVAEIVALNPDFSVRSRQRIVARPCGMPPTIVASRSHLTPATEEFIMRFPAAEIAYVGSSLKFCMIAAGEADLYPRFSRTMEWDTAAGDAVLRAAGGHCETPNGLPLRYGKRRQEHDVDFANPSFIARGQGEAPRPA